MHPSDQPASDLYTQEVAQIDSLFFLKGLNPLW